MNKLVHHKNMALTCYRDDYENGLVSKQHHFHNCLIYMLQRDTYDPSITLATACYMRDNTVLGTWHSRITKVTPHLHANSPDSPSNLVKTFGTYDASMLDSRDSYRELLALASPITTKQLLLSAHDASALNAFRANGQLYKKLVSKQSLHGLIVNDEEFYTYISLKLILDANVIGEPISELHATLLTTGNDVMGTLGLDFHFSHTSSPLALPINVIIGANGVGKTRALQAVGKELLDKQKIKAATKQPQKRGNGNPIIVFTHEVLSWKSLQRRIFKHVPLGITQADWAKLPAITQEISILPEGNFSLATLNKTLGKVVNTSNLYVTRMGSNNTTYSLDELAHDPGKCAHIDLSMNFKFIDELGLEHYLSSGQRALICFCFNLVLHCRPRSVLLVDEPENHLHPRFISLLMQTLHSVLVATESVAIVATHSPFVVREVDKSGVVILQADQQNLPSLFRPGMQTLGGDVSLISDYVFEDLNVRKGYQESIDQALLAGRSDPVTRDRILKQFAALGSDAAAYVRSLER